MEVAAESSGRPRELIGSIPVRSVQELVANRKELTAEILERYIRPEMMDDRAADISDDYSEGEGIPVIDMSRLLDEKCAEEEAAKLKFACEDWGFFQLVNHGVPEEVMEEMRANIKGFFELPLKERETVAQLPGDYEGYGQAFVVSEEQKLDWADTLVLWTQPPQLRNFRHWPSKPSTFREALNKYSLELRGVSNCILGFIAQNLGVNPDKLIEIIGSQAVRMGYYPPCPAESHDQVLGLSPHSDACGLTLLLQVTPLAGLQITRNHAWLLVEPLPNALIVNVGDSLEIFSNGKYKSIEHRAIVSELKERMSIATFHSPNFGEMLGPLPEVVGEDKVLYKTLTIDEYTKIYMTKKLDGKSTVEYVKLNP